MCSKALAGPHAPGHPAPHLHRRGSGGGFAGWCADRGAASAGRSPGARRPPRL